MKEFAQRPRLVLLTEEDKDQIHQALMEILGKIGMQILHDEALNLLRKAGCKVRENGNVRIPSSLVEKAVQSAPRNILIYDREGKLSMELGGHRSYFGTGSDLLYTLEATEMERRPSLLDDVGRAAHLCDALPNIDFIMSCAHPSDLDPQKAFLASFQAMVENSSKPIVSTAECRNAFRLWPLYRVCE